MLVEGIVVGVALILEAVVIGRVIAAYRRIEKYQYQQAVERRKDWNNAWN